MSLYFEKEPLEEVIKRLVDVVDKWSGKINKDEIYVNDLQILPDFVEALGYQLVSRFEKREDTK